MNVQQIATRLMQDEVVAYPTEAVFGLGCNPLSESAVRKLLNLKQRPIEKGLILVAPSLHFLQPFVDFSCLSNEQLARLQAQYEHPITWVVPAKTEVPNLRLEIAYDLFLCHLSVAGNIFRLPKGI